MSNLSEHKVVVVCDFSERMNDVILHGVRMADILKKELCLLGLWRNKSHKIEIQEKISQTIRSIQINIPNMQISSLLLPKSLRNNMVKLVEDYNAVLVVMHQTELKSGLRAFRESRIAFLFVNGNSPHYLNYKNVFVPVDCRKASKETALWASYLGRLNQSMIHLVYARETDSEQLGQLNKNLNSIQKFLSSLNVRHQFISGKTTSWGICKETLTNAQTWNGDVLVFAGSTYISLIDLIIGLPEKKMIRMAGDLPILIINPRKDTCIICD